MPLIKSEAFDVRLVRRPGKGPLFNPRYLAQAGKLRPVLAEIVTVEKMRWLRPGVNSPSSSNLLAIHSVELEPAGTVIPPFPTPSQVLARIQSVAIGASKKRPARRLEKKGAHMLAG